MSTLLEAPGDFVGDGPSVICFSCAPIPTMHNDGRSTRSFSLENSCDPVATECKLVYACFSTPFLFAIEHFLCCREVGESGDFGRKTIDSSYSQDSFCFSCNFVIPSGKLCYV